MYDDLHLTWGTVDVSINSKGETHERTFRFIVDKVVQDFRSFGLTKLEAHGHDEIDQSEHNKVVGSKTMQLAFFIEGSKISAQINFLLDRLVKDVFFEVSMIVILATVLLIVLGVMRVKRLAYKMT